MVFHVLQQKEYEAVKSLGTPTSLTKEFVKEQMGILKDFCVFDDHKGNFQRARYDAVKTILSGFTSEAEAERRIRPLKFGDQTVSEFIAMWGGDLA